MNAPLGNVKRAIDGTDHAWNPRNAGSYFAEFAYGFNRRYQPDDLVPRVRLCRGA